MHCYRLRCSIPYLLTIALLFEIPVAKLAALAYRATGQSLTLPRRTYEP